MRLIKNSHSACILSYHLVLVCKKRQAFFGTQATLDTFKKAFDIVAAKHDVVADRINDDTNHIHVLFSANITTNLKQFISSVKSCSSRLMKQHHKQFAWSAGLFIGTVGAANEQTIIDYIENQGR